MGGDGENEEFEHDVAAPAGGSAAALLFQDITYSVDKRSLFRMPPCANRRKTIIENCSGIVHQGEIVAILGSSGAGKSTLLDVLAKRKTYGNIGGTVLYNGKEIKSSHLPTNIAGYVRQDDYHLAALTVRETLLFAADLRCRVSDREKREKVDYLIKALSLTHAQHNKVGDRVKRGISGGEARRLSIGMEMLNDPDLLFLDEPTSGLDSSSAKNVVLLMRRLVRKRKNAALCTIHQPSREVFEYFDKCLLLAKSESGVGTIAYFGPVMGVVPYFTRLGYPPKSHRINPSDHMVQLCSIKRDPSLLTEDEEEETLLKKQRTMLLLEGFPDENVEAEKGPEKSEKETEDENSVKVQELIDQYHKSDEKHELDDEIEEAKKRPPSHRDTTWRPLPLWAQILVLTRRSYTCLFNDKEVLSARVIVLVFLGIIMCSAYWQLSYDSQDVQNRVSLIFFVLLSSYMASEPFYGLFPRERVLVNHEKGAKLYGPFPYFVSTIVTVIPLQLLLSQIYASVIYWSANLRNTFTHYSIFLIEYSLIVVTMICYALAMGAFSPNVEAALGMSAIVFTIMLLFNGFFLLAESIPPWWIWANWISPYKYAFFVTLNNEFHNKIFDPCEDGEDSCGFKDGNELLDFYGANRHELLWPYIAVSFGFLIVFAIIAYLCLRFMKHEKR
eukprot:TRINITY_DN553_c0_g1_i1.p1 TRINITY_DN553_c0_g1~~TRINITY_DN553_c0_g1_i1.p1  ORF type:complete len:670 (+),score=256.24 TRINITY_DN553_c0_g1_i1:194-2203(+)